MVHVHIPFVSARRLSFAKSQIHKDFVKLFIFSHAERRRLLTLNLFFTPSAELVVEEWKVWKCYKTFWILNFRLMVVRILDRKLLR